MFSFMKSEEEVQGMKEVIPNESTAKDYVIVPDGRYGLYKIQWEDGAGVLPKELSGRYTSVEQAKRAINTYEVKNGPLRGAKEARRKNYEQRKKEEKEYARKEELKANEEKGKAVQKGEQEEVEDELILKDESKRYTGSL